MKLCAVILDWAGTVVDFGSCAPVDAFCEAFAAAGVPITRDEARGPMGLAKRAHVEALLQQNRIREAWEHVNNLPPSDADIDAIYADFIPRQINAIARHAELIPGIPAAAERLRERGLKIGTTTGYTRAMLDCLLVHAREQGFVPDVSICPDDVPAGRPHPYMCYLNAIQLQAHPLWAIVKIGDTCADVEEGRNAGMWTIVVTRTGNEVGLTQAEWSALARADQGKRLDAARQKLAAARPHYFAESAAECDEILREIDARLDRGQRP